MRGEELVRLRERCLPRQLLEHLALLRAVQVERVEELRDLVVTLVDDLDAVEPGVDVVEDGAPLLPAPRHRPSLKRCCQTLTAQRIRPGSHESARFWVYPWSVRYAT